MTTVITAMRISTRNCLRGISTWGVTVMQKQFKNNEIWQNYISNEQNRINNVTDELELNYDDGFDFER